MYQGVSKIFQQHLYTHHYQPVCYIARNNSQLSCKTSVFGYPPSTGHGMLYCKECHPLLLKCFITFLRCIWMIAGAFGSIESQVMITPLSFLKETTLNFHAKYQTLGTLSARGMDYYTAKKYIHCCLGVS